MAAKRRPGERAGLSRESILDAALRLTDRHGLAGLTMRALARELGVEAMTLYHHVPGKDALLDGLVERVITGALPLSAGDHEALLREYAESLRAVLLRHPALMPVLQGRPVVTEATLASVEKVLAALVAAGRPLGEAVHLVNCLTVFVFGHTTAEAAMAARTEPAGSTTWLTGQAADRYPHLVEAARTAQGTDDGERFRLGVQALITGFAAAGTTASARGAARRS